MRTGKRYRLLRIVLPAGFVLTLSALILGNGRWTALHFSDDSFFYLQTALNAGRGLGSTFDGINRTDGYQFLWFHFLVLISGGLQSMAPLRQLQAVALINTLLNGLSLVILINLGRSLSLSPLFAAAAAGAAVCGFAFDTFGMETSFEVLLALWLLNSVASELRHGRSSGCYRVAIVSAAFLLPLARTDAVIFCCSLTGALLLLWLWRQQIPVADVFAPAVAGTCAILLQAASNLIRSGHSMTIAAYLKFYPSRALPPQWFSETGTLTRLRFVALWVLSLLVLGWGLPRLRRVSRGATCLARLNDARTACLLSLGGAAFIELALLFCFDTAANFAWYFAWPTLAMVISLAVVISTLPAGHGRTFGQAVTAALFVAIALAFADQAGLWRASTTSPTPDFLPALTAHVGPNQRLFMIDESGRTAFWSGRPVINGDGLINGWNYQTALHSGELAGYFARQRIAWVLSDPLSSRVSGGRIYIWVPGWRGCYLCGGRLLGSAPVTASVYAHDGYYLIPTSAIDFQRHG